MDDLRIAKSEVAFYKMLVTFMISKVEKSQLRFTRSRSQLMSLDGQLRFTTDFTRSLPSAWKSLLSDEARTLVANSRLSPFQLNRSLKIRKNLQLRCAFSSIKSIRPINSGYQGIRAQNVSKNQLRLFCLSETTPPSLQAMIRLLMSSQPIVI